MWKKTYQNTMPTYRQTFTKSRTLAGNKIADHSDVVGAVWTGDAPTTFPLSTWSLASIDWAIKLQEKT